MPSTRGSRCRVEGLPVRFGEHPSFVVPELAGGLALGFLVLLVDLQQDDEGVRQADRAPTGTGFRRAGVGANLLAAGAVPGLSAARAAAPVLVLGA